MSRHKLSKEFSELSKICNSKKILLADLFELFSTRGHALISLFLALPFLMPIPMPGLSVIFGLIISVVGIQMALHVKPWFPKKWMQLEIKTEILQKFFSGAERVTIFLERFIKPRGLFLSSHQLSHAIVGILIAFSGILLALPLPPGTNFPPALAILLLSIALLEHDGLLLILGLVVFVLNLILFHEMIIIALHLVEKMFHRYFS